jgi:hypothetical protein
MCLRTTVSILWFIAFCLGGNLAQTPGQSATPIITLERATDAFGVAPAYKLSIYADGTVIYKARPHETAPMYNRKPNVNKRRTAKSKISQADIQQLISEFERIDYFSLKDDYGMSGGVGPTRDCPRLWTDQPSAYTSLIINGKSKRIAHYSGCKGNDAAEKLTQLENRIDEIVNTNRWVK